jgi:hypothetical protein
MHTSWWGSVWFAVDQDGVWGRSGRSKDVRRAHASGHVTAGQRLTRARLPTNCRTRGHQVFLTDTAYGEGSLQHLEVRHRAHARVEDRIRCGKTTGFGRFPSRHFAINQAWLELSLTALDLLAWTRTLLLEGELATAEPKKLRYRLLHAAAGITRGGRRLHLRISATWPWRNELTSAFARLATLPRPAT